MMLISGLKLAATGSILQLTDIWITASIVMDIG